METKKLFNFFKQIFFIIIYIICLNTFFEYFFTNKEKFFVNDVEKFIPYKNLNFKWLNQTGITLSQTSNRKCTITKCINVQRCISYLNKLTIALQPIFDLKNEKVFCIKNSLFF